MEANLPAMTGPGRSPSSPWVQSAQSGHHDGGVTQSFHSTMSPSTTGMMSSAAFTERSSPNYFGMAVQSPNNQQTSNPGLPMQKNWSTLPHTQPLPSPKLPTFSQESVSAGLKDLLKTETETSRIRRESAFHGPSSPQTTSWSNPSPSHSLGNFSFAQPNELRLPAGKNSAPAPQGMAVHLRQINKILTLLLQEPLPLHFPGYQPNAAPNSLNHLSQTPCYSMFAHLLISDRPISKDHSIYASPLPYLSVDHLIRRN